MIRLISISAVVALLLAISLAANAQGRPPGGAGSGASNRPSMSQHRDMSSMRQQADAWRQAAEMRRQEAEAKRLIAEAKRLIAEVKQQEADARRAEAGAMVEEFGQSVAMRAAHPPNSNAADVAFRAALNADDNLALRDDRPDLAGENRREHGVDNRGEHGGGDPDDNN